MIAIPSDAHLVAGVDLSPLVDSNEWCITCQCGQRFVSKLALIHAIDSYGHHLIDIAIKWGRQSIPPEINDRNPDPDPGPVYVPRSAHRLFRWFGFDYSPTKTTR